MSQRPVNNIGGRYKGYWAAGRLIIGIISVLLSIFLAALTILSIIYLPKPRLQFINIFTVFSCLVPVAMFIAGFVGVCTSNSRKRNGAVIAFVLYIFAGLFSPPLNFFLLFRMIISFIFGAVFLISAIKTNKQ